GEALDRVSLPDDTELPTRTVVWSGGVRPNDPSREKSLERSRSKRVVVDEHLRVLGADGVFAIGDVASRDEDGTELPMLSPPAMQEGRHVAAVILAGGRGGRGLKPFRYVDKGTMATIGRNSAVGQIRRLRCTG